MKRLATVMAAVSVAGGLFLAGRPVQAGLIDSLVAHYRFDDNTSSATLAADSTGNHNGTLVNVGGVPTFSTGSRGSGTSNTHVIGAGALDFTGVSGYLQAIDATGSPLDTATGTTQERSVSFWFKTPLNQNRVILEKGSNAHFVPQTWADGKVQWRVTGGSLFSATATNDDAWHHFIGTFTGSDIRLYIDGALQGTLTNSATADDNNPLVIGARAGGSYPFEGKMDEVMVWNRQITTAPARVMYQHGLLGQDAVKAIEPLFHQIEPVSYQYDATGTSQPNNLQVEYLDPGNRKLTDVYDVLGHTTAYRDDSWVGFREASGDNGQPQPAITFDLGIAQQLGEIRMIYLDSGGNGGIYSPDEVRVSYSLDNVSFTDPLDRVFTGFTHNPSGTQTVEEIALDVFGDLARYVRLEFYNDQQWTFLGEVAFFGVPEPSTFAMAALGLLGLGFVGWRRKQK